MKKFISRSLVAAAMMAMPVVAQAQYDVRLQVTAQTIDAGPGGGQFALSAPGTLGNILGYCIDQERGFLMNTFYTYRVYTFAQYTASLSAHAVFGRTTDDELNKMVVNAGVIAVNGGTKNAAQQDTWSMFATAGDNNPGTAPVAPAGWIVLVSVDAINGTGDPNGSGKFGQQTFISTVPEPSTYMLMAVGLAALGMASKRRRKA